VVSVDISTDIVIDRPVDEVAAYAADPDNAPHWYANIKSVEWETPRAIQVGARIAFVAHFLGRRMSYTYEILEFVPCERLVMRTVEGPFPMETTYLWQAIGSNVTRMTLSNRGNPSGFSRSYAPLAAKAMRKANQKDLALLKRRLETPNEPL
jgi:uncharacterized membrane protein